ncbi:hypothetical protein ANN_01438 [Periplaneta americana]|uniref:Uncharacterized protein n=1 Tax=Periplaneta americana TaxID=6978 RepID=A0ABQ8TW02_PERAM|nr:hypothetical protein ANN_01438 [Periplaneta americana]
MSPESSTESYSAFAHLGLRENPGKNLNQVTCPDRESNPGLLVSQPDALTVTPQSISGLDHSVAAVTRHLKAQELVIYCKKLIFSYHIAVFENMNKLPCTAALYVKPSTELYATPEPHNLRCCHPLPTPLL